MVSLTTDHVFTIGARHLSGGLPCQDHTLAGTLSGATFVLVADGCSSGDRTDIGARLLNLVTAQALAGVWNADGKVSDLTTLVPHVQTARLTVLQKLQPLLGVNQQDLLATSGMAVITQKHGGLLHLDGDGVLATLDNTGTLQVHRYDWANNTPWYPAYALTGGQAFTEAHGGDPAVSKLYWETWSASAGQPLVQQDAGSHSLVAGMGGVTHFLTADQVANLAYAAVFTDGVTQISDCEWTDAVTSLLAFKTSEGTFAVRRLTRLLDELRKSNRKPIDDLGYGVIRIRADPSPSPEYLPMEESDEK